MSHEKLVTLIKTALFAALTVVATMIIRVPTIGTNGYVNIGDTMVLLSAWIIGGWYGAFAAGLGSALADILSGYAVYAPGTFVIKAGMALAAFALFKALNKVSVPQIIKYILTALLAEVVMIAGYFVYESVFLGYGLAAAPSIISNAFQALSNIILGVLLVFALEKAKVFKNPAIQAG